MRGEQRAVPPTAQQQREMQDYTKSGQYYPFPVLRIRPVYDTDHVTLDSHPHYTDCNKEFVEYKHTTGTIVFV